jgi:hypothetical protein
LAALAARAAAIAFQEFPVKSLLMMLFVFVVMSHNRRKVIHFNVTSNPSAQWAAQQITEAFPWDGAAEVQHRNTYLGLVKQTPVDLQVTKRISRADHQ